MGPVARAKAFVTFVHVLGWAAAVAMAGGFVYLLWIWAVAHPISFFPIVGIIVVCLAVWGICEGYAKAKKTIEKADEEEKILQYENTHGVKPRWDYRLDRYMFEVAPDPISRAAGATWNTSKTGDEYV